MQEKSIQDLECTALTNIFAEAGKKHGYSNMKADFTAFRDLKVSWTRTYRNAEFHVADYLKDAPEGVLQSLAETLFAKIMGEDGAKYSEEFCRYITSEQFVNEHQYTYLKRSRNITMSPAGEHKHLLDSYQRLIDAGFVKKDENLVLVWMKNEGTGSVGYASTLMHVIVMSKMLDREDMPDYVLDYALFTQIVKMTQGMVNFCSRKSNEAERLEKVLSEYPRAEKAKEMLEGFCIRL